jgi:hypothetical protein
MSSKRHSALLAGTAGREIFEAAHSPRSDSIRRRDNSFERDREFESAFLQRSVMSEPWAKGARDVDLDLASPLLGLAVDRYNRGQGVVSHG